MPIYEYQCQQCGHHHEALQKISDPQLRQCPECGRKSLKRLMSAVRFRLAGSGWYETDFKSDKEAKRNLHEKADKDEAKADGSGGSEGESKAERQGSGQAGSEGRFREGRFRKGRFCEGDPKSASSEPTESGKRSRVSRQATAAVRSKSNGRTKPARRAPAVRRRGR